MGALLPNPDPLLCEICDEPAVGVGASRFGPVSHAYCRECLDNKREVWSTLVCGLMGTSSKDDVASWAHSSIDNTCKFYGKTEEELWDEVTELTQDFMENRYYATPPTEKLNG